MNMRQAARVFPESSYSLSWNSTIMKTNSVLATIGVCLTILSSASVLITVVVVLDNRELRREIRTLHTDLHQARVDVSRLREETTDAAERLAAKQSDLLELEKELTRSKAADA